MASVLNHLDEPSSKQINKNRNRGHALILKGFQASNKYENDEEQKPSSSKNQSELKNSSNQNWLVNSFHLNKLQIHQTPKNNLKKPLQILKNMLESCGQEKMKNLKYVEQPKFQSKYACKTSNRPEDLKRSNFDKSLSYSIPKSSTRRFDTKVQTKSQNKSDLRMIPKAMESTINSSRFSSPKCYVPEYHKQISHLKFSKIPSKSNGDLLIRHLVDNDVALGQSEFIRST